MGLKHVAGVALISFATIALVARVQMLRSLAGL